MSAANGSAPTLTMLLKNKSSDNRVMDLCVMQYVEINYAYFDGLMQDCSISSALTMEILQSCTKPSICSCFVVLCFGLLQMMYPYPSGLLHWHWGNLMIAPVPVK